MNLSGGDQGSGTMPESYLSTSLPYSLKSSSVLGAVEKVGGSCVFSLYCLYVATKLT